MSHTRELTERYRLEKILKSTRAGTVLKATDLTSGRGVVVKLIHMGASPDAAVRRDLFLRLGSALAEPRHPSLPRVLDAGFTPDGSAFLVLERLEGQPFDALTGAVPSRILALLEQAVGGLEALVAQGLPHLNLSPDNLLVLSSLTGESVKLLGLGTSLFRQASAPEAARFQAPEHAGAAGPAAADWRADLWSLALVACQVLGAKVGSFDSPRPEVTLPLGVSFELEDPEALRLVLERSLRRDPAERPVSYQQVRDSFGLALGRTFAVAQTRVGAGARPEPAVPGGARSAPAQPPAARPPLHLVNPARPAPPKPPVPAAPAAAPSPAEEMESGELLRPIDDELLARVGLPEPKAAAPAVPQDGDPTRPLRPARRSDKMAFLAAAGAAALLLLAAGAWWLLGGRSDPPPPAQTARPLPPPPREPATRRLAAARDLLAGGQDDRAREILAALTPEDQASLSAADCELLRLVQETLARATVDRLANDLPNGLKSGSLALLLPVVRAAVEQQIAPTGLYTGAEEDFTAAVRLAEVYGAAEAAAGEKDHARVLERFRELHELFPRQSDSFHLREQAAAALEAEAEALATGGDYPAAVARLEVIARAWPDWPGLAARIEETRGFKSQEPAQLKILDNLVQYERRKKPADGLDTLAGVEPIPHLAARFAEGRKRLEAQLAELDKSPPVVELRDQGALEYDRGTMVLLSFRVKDDYEVKDIKVMARRQGGRMQEMEYERAGLGYEVEIPPSFHQNETIEIYVTATDLSGHEGGLGSRDQPLQITRSQSFDRLLRN